MPAVITKTLYRDGHVNVFSFEDSKAGRIKLILALEAHEHDPRWPWNFKDTWLVAKNICPGGIKSPLLA